jgi:hypothetical protein
MTMEDSPKEAIGGGPVPPPAAPTIEVVREFDIDMPFIPDMSLAAQRAFRGAFAKAQASYKPVIRSREVTITPRAKDGYQAPSYKFKYAELANVKEATHALSENGISVSQPVHQDREKAMWLYTILAHADGGGQVTRIRLDGSGDIKVFGGEITYVRRYCFAPAVGVASEDDADDNGGGGGGGDDDGQYRRVRDGGQDAPAAAGPVRRKAAAKTAPKGEDAQPEKQQAAAGPKKPSPGALKFLQNKLATLDEEARAELLKRLEVKAIDETLTLDDWTRVSAAVDESLGG